MQFRQHQALIPHIIAQHIWDPMTEDEQYLQALNQHPHFICWPNLERHDSQYSLSQCHLLDEILTGSRLSLCVIETKDQLIYAESYEYMKRSFSAKSPSVEESEIVSRIRMLSDYYENEIRISFEHPGIHLHGTKKIFLNRIRRTKMMLRQEGSSDDSATLTKSSGLPAESGTYLKSVIEAQTSKTESFIDSPLDQFYLYDIYREEEIAPSEVQDSSQASVSSTIKNIIELRSNYSEIAEMTRSIKEEQAPDYLVVEVNDFDEDVVAAVKSSLQKQRSDPNLVNPTSYRSKELEYNPQKKGILTKFPLKCEQLKFAAIHEKPKTSSQREEPKKSALREQTKFLTSREQSQSKKIAENQKYLIWDDPSTKVSTTTAAPINYFRKEKSQTNHIKVFQAEKKHKETHQQLYTRSKSPLSILKSEPSQIEKSNAQKITQESVNFYQKANYQLTDNESFVSLHRNTTQTYFETSGSFSGSGYEYQSMTSGGSYLPIYASPFQSKVAPLALKQDRARHYTPFFTQSWESPYMPSHYQKSQPYPNRNVFSPVPSQADLRRQHIRQKALQLLTGSNYRSQGLWLASSKERIRSRG